MTIDNRDVYNQIVEYVRTFDPDLLERIHFYESETPLFDHAGIEEEIQRTFRRRVDLPSGGHVIIEPTEAVRNTRIAISHTPIMHAATTG